LVGLACWLGYYLVVLGLKYTTPGKNAFISGCYCVIVPFLGIFLGLDRPMRHNLVAAVLCVVGLGFIGADGGFPLNIGDLISFGAAVFFALQFSFVSKFGRDTDVWALTIWSFLVTAMLSIAATLLFEEIPQPDELDPPAILAFLYSGILGTCVAEGLVNYAFTKVDATSGSLIASLESPISVLASLLVGYDVFTMRLGLGFAFVFLAIVVSEAWPGIAEGLGLLGNGES
ncbi:MAG: DMT family transporter, partial [Atopobiaceae bacterium]|nr:DMT family transporter [Atopobiaceae bacterium]